jgi:hypothetical protein
MSQHPCCISAVKGANGTGGGTGGSVPTTGAVRYIGCFKDTSAFDLNGFLERSQSNTPQRCVQTCAAKGFAYAGVQYGQSCLCGNSYGKYGPATNCDYKCTGDAGQICGGYATNSVYATGQGAVPQPQPQPQPREANFTGTWDGGWFTTTFVQTGNRVTGSFTHRDGKVWDGVVTGNTLTCKWSQNNLPLGTATLIMDPGGKSFHGSASWPGGSNTWNGKKIGD